MSCFPLVYAPLLFLLSKLELSFPFRSSLFPPFLFLVTSNPPLEIGGGGGGGEEDSTALWYPPPILDGEKGELKLFSLFFLPPSPLDVPLWPGEGSNSTNLGAGKPIQTVSILISLIFVVYFLLFRKPSIWRILSWGSDEKTNLLCESDSVPFCLSPLYFFLKTTLLLPPFVFASGRNFFPLFPEEERRKAPTLTYQKKRGSFPQKKYSPSAHFSRIWEADRIAGKAASFEKHRRQKRKLENGSEINVSIFFYL